MTFSFSDNITVTQSQNLYRWAKIWGKVQKNYYKNQVYLRREKQIEDFVSLNEFKNVYVEKDTDILVDLNTVDQIDKADLVVITDQKFSRKPCVGIIESIEHVLSQCPRLYLCLNSHYINIDSQFNDASLDDNYNLAITQWLKKNLPQATVLDLSLDVIDRGDWFTWVVPDKMYYIEKTCD
jgi:hypothetical protein